MGRVYHPKERLKYFPEDVSAALAHVRRDKMSAGTCEPVQPTSPTTTPVNLIQVPGSSQLFDKTFAFKILEKWFIKNDVDPEKVEISKVTGRDNSEQGLLSTTYVMDIEYKVQGDEELKKKSVFVKVPLKGEAGAPYKQMNVREYEMYANALPELQKYLSENCKGFFCLGVPEIIYCNYVGDEVHDVFIIENLLATGFQTCVTSDLKLSNGGKDYLRSTLETLAQLHGTGLVYKNSLGGNEAVIKKFPNIEEQIQIKDILSKEEQKTMLTTYFSPFIRYVEELDPELKNITQYMRKMEGYLMQILQVLEDSNVSKLNTLCHGDAKPNNFMFRKIDVDFEDEELKDLACEGVESMLIDWQQGFLGSVCSDLMWCIYPFLEVNGHDTDLYEFTFRHYFQELKNVLETFETTLEEHGLPNNMADFRSLIRRGYVLEFMIVTSLRPVLNIKEPEKVMAWYKKLTKYEKKVEKGGIHKLLARKPPKLPVQDDVFVNQRYMYFLQFYFKIATTLGAFQEMGLVYFELMKNEMFKDGLKMKSIVKPKPKAFTADWFKQTFFKCIIPQTKDEDEKVEEPTSKEEKIIKEQEKVPFKPKEDIIYADEETAQPEKKEVVESIYEDIQKPETQTVVAEINPVEAVPKEKSPSPVDPLRALASKLHSDILQYKESYTDFKIQMDNIDPPTLENVECSTSNQNGIDGHSTNSDYQIDENFLNIKFNNNDLPLSAIPPNNSDLAVSGMVPNNSYSSNFGDRHNSNARDIVFPEKIEEVVKMLSSEKLNDFDQDTEKSINRDRKISVQSVDTRKDSFCSSLSKQELVDLLDQDEAEWDIVRDPICQSIKEETMQSLDDDSHEPKGEPQKNSTATKEINTVDTVEIKEGNTTIEISEPVSENKDAVLAWLNVAKTTSESENHENSDEETSENCVHGVLTLKLGNEGENSIKAHNENKETVLNKQDSCEDQNEDQSNIENKQQEPDNRNSILAWLNIKPGNIDMGIKEVETQEYVPLSFDDIEPEEVKEHQENPKEEIDFTNDNSNNFAAESPEADKCISTKYEITIDEDVEANKKTVRTELENEATKDNIVDARIELPMEKLKVEIVTSETIESNAQEETTVENLMESRIEESKTVVESENEINNTIENEPSKEKIEEEMSKSPEIVTEIENVKENESKNENIQEEICESQVTENTNITVEISTEISIEEVTNQVMEEVITELPKELDMLNNESMNEPKINDEANLTTENPGESRAVETENSLNEFQNTDFKSENHHSEQQASNKENLNVHSKTENRLSAHFVEAIDVMADDISKEILTSTLKRKKKENKIVENNVQSTDLNTVLGNLPANKDVSNIVDNVSKSIDTDQVKNEILKDDLDNEMVSEAPHLNGNNDEEIIENGRETFTDVVSKEFEEKLASPKSISILRKITIDVKTTSAKSQEALEIDNDEDLPILIDSTPSSAIQDYDATPFIPKTTPRRLKQSKDLKERKELAKSVEIFEYIAENIDQPLKSLIEKAHNNDKEKEKLKDDQAFIRHAASTNEISYLSIDELVGSHEKVLVNVPLSADELFKATSASTSSLDKEQVKAKIVQYFAKLVKEDKMSRDLGREDIADTTESPESSLERSTTGSRNSASDQEESGVGEVDTTATVDNSSKAEQDNDNEEDTEAREDGKSRNGSKSRSSTLKRNKRKNSKKKRRKSKGYA